MISRLKFLVAVFLLMGVLAANLVCIPLPVEPAPGETPAPAAPPTQSNGVQPATPTATPAYVPTPVPTRTLPAAAPAPSLPMSIPDVVDMVKPGVVSITVKALAYDFFLRPVPEEGAGTGFIFDPNGYIVTNNHVVEGSQTIKVSLSDGRSFDGTVVGTDIYSDVAVVKINANNLPVLRLGDSKTLRVGEWVVALGNALGLEGGPTVTAGIISYLGRQIQEPNGTILEDLIQTDAAVNPGNSGGPLVDLSGQVIGINTAIASGAENIGFAVSIHTFLPVVQELIAKGKVDRPYLGVELQTVTPAIARQYNLGSTKGALITNVGGGTPADRAGLKRGDVVTRLGSRTVTTADELRAAIVAHKVGETVTIVFIRGGKEQSANAPLTARP